MNESTTAAATGIHCEIQSHYGRPHLVDVLLTALQKAGKDLTQITTEELAPIDEFHSRGRAATLELARTAGLEPEMRVLDVGSGIGGTARCLAQEFGCRVTGIDLTDEYCRTATLLAARTGLAGLVDFRQGNATNLPFADGSFDAVWTEHVSMNIPDKSRLYAEMYRVLRPGGTVAIHDILAGANGPVIFPVPWARTAQTSFLVTPSELRMLIEESGFQISEWSDPTSATRAWFAAMADKNHSDGPPVLGLHLLIGPTWGEMVQNLRRNLDEGRTVLAQVIARK